MDNNKFWHGPLNPNYAETFRKRSSNDRGVLAKCLGFQVWSKVRNRFKFSACKHIVVQK